MKRLVGQHVVHLCPRYGVPFSHQTNPPVMEHRDVILMAMCPNGTWAMIRRPMAMPYTVATRELIAADGRPNTD